MWPAARWSAPRPSTSAACSPGRRSVRPLSATTNSYGAGGTGTHADTEDAYVAAYNGQPAGQNGLTLNTTAATLNSASGVSGTLSGNISGVGAETGTYTLSVSREFSGAESGVTIGYTANPVNERSFSNGSISLNRALCGTPPPRAPAAVTSLTGSGNTATVTLFATSTVVDGLTLSGAVATLNGNTTSNGYSLSGNVSAGVINSTLYISGTDEFNNALNDIASVTLTGTAVSQRTVTAGAITLGNSNGRFMSTESVGGQQHFADLRRRYSYTRSRSTARCSTAPCRPERTR